MDALTLRKKVQRKAKIRGLYSIKLEALDEIVSFVSRFHGFEDDAIELVLDDLHEESCTVSSSFILHLYLLCNSPHSFSWTVSLFCLLWQ